MKSTVLNVVNVTINILVYLSTASIPKLINRTIVRNIFCFLKEMFLSFFFSSLDISPLCSSMKHTDLSFSMHISLAPAYVVMIVVTMNIIPLNPAYT